MHRERFQFNASKEKRTVRVKLEEFGSDAQPRVYYTYDIPRIGETVVVSPEGFEARIVDIKHALFGEHGNLPEPILIVARIAEDMGSAT
jgi:hypothetical protein